MMMMNTSHLTLSLFLIISISICVAAGTGSPVIDADRDEVKPGALYTIKAVIYAGSGGGLTLAKTGDRECPLSVVQELSDEGVSGLPLSFHPADEQESVVRASTNVNIKFNATTRCNTFYSTVWQMQYDRPGGKLMVTTGGEIGNPSPETENNWFKLEELSPPVYKLTVCPNICEDYCEPFCGDLFILGDDLGSSKRRLVMNSTTSSNDRAFWVTINKAVNKDNLMMIRNLKPQA